MAEKLIAGPMSVASSQPGSPERMSVATMPACAHAWVSPGKSAAVARGVAPMGPLHAATMAASRHARTTATTRWGIESRLAPHHGAGLRRPVDGPSPGYGVVDAGTGAVPWRPSLRHPGLVPAAISTEAHVPTIRPFRALRYNREAVEDLAQVVAPPYDV